MLMVMRSDESTDQRETAASTDTSRRNTGSAPSPPAPREAPLRDPGRAAQLAYLARTLVDGLSAAERQDYFAPAGRDRPGRRRPGFEERHTLGIIAKYLYVTPERRSQP